MRKILNPYMNTDGFNCFGCSPGNSLGLAMEFFEDGGEIVSIWKPKDLFAGVRGVLHGGIQAALHDEIACWVVFVILKTAGFTSDLQVKYLNPVYIKNGSLTLRSRLSRMDGNIAHMHTTLTDGNGTLCSESDAAYYTVPPHIAKRKFSYPGIEAFYEKADRPEIG